MERNEKCFHFIKEKLLAKIFHYDYSQTKKKEQNRTEEY